MKIIVLCTMTILITFIHTVIVLGVQQSIQLPISTAVTTNAQSLLSGDQQHHGMSSSE